MEKNQEIIYCIHCGNKTLMNCYGEYIHNWDDGDGYYGKNWYQLFECPICGWPTLSCDSWDSSIGCGEDEFLDKSIIYPINRIAEKGIPPKIKSAFEAALKIKNIDTPSCLMAIRRTIELILLDKGATSWGLEDKINELEKKGILPEILKKSSGFIKHLGDTAAHSKALLDKVTIHEVNTLIDFTEHIINYIYILPKKIESYERRLNVMRKKSDTISNRVLEEKE